MELTEEIQRDPGRFLQNIDMTKVKTKEDLREALRRQDTRDKRGRDWEESVSRVVERSEALFGTGEVQDQISENIEREIESLSPEELESYSLPPTIRDESKFAKAIENIQKETAREVARQEREISQRVAEEELSRAEKDEIRRQEREMIQKIEGKEIKNLRLYYL